MVSAVARVSSDEPKSGSAPHLHLVPFEIDDDDAKELRWLFRRVGSDQGDWEHHRAPVISSTFGVQLEMVSRRSGGSKACPTCNGHGWLSSKRRKALLAGKSGDPEAYLLQLFTAWEQRTKIPRYDRLCERCKGLGHVARETPHRARGPITVRETGSSVTSRAYSASMSTDDLVRLASIHAKLMRLYDSAPDSALVFAAYYGPHGGDPVSLWHLTPSGKTMLRGMPEGLRHVEFFDNLRNANQERPDPNLTLQCEAANEQAEAILDEAKRAWVRVNG